MYHQNTLKIFSPMKLSRSADNHCVTVLLNLATAGTVQIPSKLFLFLFSFLGMDTEQTLSRSHRSTSIHKDCNLVSGLQSWWGLKPHLTSRGWSACSVVQLVSWEVRARQCFWIIPHDMLNLIETPKHMLSLLIFHCHGDIPILIILFLAFPPQQPTSSCPCLSDQAHLPCPSFLFFNFAEWHADHQCLPLMSSLLSSYCMKTHFLHIMMFWYAPFSIYIE